MYKKFSQAETKAQGNILNRRSRKWYSQSLNECYYWYQNNIVHKELHKDNFTDDTTTMVHCAVPGAVSL